MSEALDAASAQTPNVTLPNALTGVRAVIVRTEEIKSLTGGNLNDTADFYARINFNDGIVSELESIEAVQRDFSELKPAWSSIYFLAEGDEPSVTYACSLWCIVHVPHAVCVASITRCLMKMAFEWLPINMC